MQTALDDLVRRRLLPVVLVLLLALVAIPLVLRKEAEPPPPPPTAGAAPRVAPVSAVRVVRAFNGGRRPRVERPGERRDPFGLPAAALAARAGGVTSGTAALLPPGARGGSSPAASATGGSAGVSAGGGAGSRAGSGASASAGGGSSGAATTPGASRTYTYYAVDLRFGTTTSARVRRNVPRLAPLPSAQNPLLFFVGVRRGGESASFRLAGDVVERAGPGTCRPRERLCLVLSLRRGQTEVITAPRRGGGVIRYRLRVVAIRKIVTRDRERAAAARRRVSPTGRCLLGFLVPLQYDQGSGTLFAPDDIARCRYEIDDGRVTLPAD